MNLLNREIFRSSNNQTITILYHLKIFRRHTGLSMPLPLARVSKAQSLQSHPNFKVRT